MTLKIRYNLLHFFFWLSNCCVSGFIAIFLQYHGLSNTEIGIVTGGSCILTVFLSPYISSLVAKVKTLTTQQLFSYLLISISTLFLCIAYLKLPVLVIMIAYILMNSLMLSAVPLLTMIAMDYLREGLYVDFGLARGIGSASWASTALVFGRLLAFIPPSVLALGCFLFNSIVLMILHAMPKSTKPVNTNQKEGTVFDVIKHYRLFFLILLGFGLAYSGTTALGTYLINIVENLGGNTTFYGIALFAMAFSELPFMTLAHRLMKRFDPYMMIAIAGIFYVFRNLTICFAPNLFILILGMMFQGLSYGLFTGVITYYITYNLELHDQMAGQTLIGIMSNGLGSTIGNLCGGVLQDTFGLSAMYLFIGTITILGAALLVFVWFLSKQHKKSIVH